MPMLADIVAYEDLKVGKEQALFGICCVRGLRAPVVSSWGCGSTWPQCLKPQRVGGSNPEIHTNSAQAELLPRVCGLCVSTTSAGVRTGALLAMGKLLPSIEVDEAKKMMTICGKVCCLCQVADDA